MRASVTNLSVVNVAANPALNISTVLGHVGAITSFAAANTLPEMRSAWAQTKPAISEYIPSNHVIHLPDTFEKAVSFRRNLLNITRHSLSKTLLANTPNLHEVNLDKLEHEPILKEMPRSMNLGVVVRYAGEYLIETAALMFPNLYRDEGIGYLSDIIEAIIDLHNDPEYARDKAIDALIALGVSSNKAYELSQTDSAHELFCLRPDLQAIIEHRLARIVQTCPDWDELYRRFHITDICLEQARHAGVISESSYLGTVEAIRTRETAEYADEKMNRWRSLTATTTKKIEEMQSRAAADAAEIAQWHAEAKWWQSEAMDMLKEQQREYSRIGSRTLITGLTSSLATALLLKTGLASGSLYAYLSSINYPLTLIFGSTAIPLVFIGFYFWVKAEMLKKEMDQSK